MGFYNQHFRAEGDCRKELKEKDPIGRWLTKATMGMVGYDINQQVESTTSHWAEYDDSYINIVGNIVTVESRTNRRLWDSCIKPNAEMLQWVRGSKGAADLLLTFGGYPHGWIGTISHGADVRSSPTIWQYNSNANAREEKYVIPWESCRSIVTIQLNLENGYTISRYDIKGSQWDIKSEPTQSVAVIDHNIPVLSKLDYRKPTIKDMIAMWQSTSTDNNFKIHL